MRYTDKLNYSTPQIKVFGVLISAPLCGSIREEEIENYSTSINIVFGSDD